MARWTTVAPTADGQSGRSLIARRGAAFGAAGGDHTSLAAGMVVRVDHARQGKSTRWGDYYAGSAAIGGATSAAIAGGSAAERGAAMSV